MIKKGHVCLDRALSKLGIASRSRAVELIKAGKVKVDGKILKNPNHEVVPEKIKITIEDKKAVAAKEVMLAFYKPRGVVTTASDEKNRQNIFDFLPKHFGKLVPVGRLDMATSGLLLLTTNTKLADFLTDPKNKIPRVYIVTINGQFNLEKKLKCEEGIWDKEELLQAQNVEILKTSLKESQIKVTLFQGKNREIRRLMDCLGHEVTKLLRISYGKISLNNLLPGQWKEISQAV